VRVPRARLAKSGAIGDAAEFARVRLGFQADDKQAEVLRSTSKRGILNCSRQWGKSTVAGIKAVHRAFTVPKSLVVVASPSERQSAEFVHKAGEWVARLGIKSRGDGKNAVSLLLPNGSRIIGLPGRESTLRGFSAASLMVIDEAARVEDNVYKMLLPMLAVSKGDLWMLSTPFGQQGFFYENWTSGDERWHRVLATALDCSRISRESLEADRAQMGNAWFRQEYLCEFVANGQSYFARELVRGALDDIEPMDFPARVTPNMGTDRGRGELLPFL
jgi:hypothetical protein